MNGFLRNASVFLASLFLITITSGGATNTPLPPAKVVINTPYTWTITTPPGATPPLEYHWTGTDGLTGTNETVTKTFVTLGEKEATATVADSLGLLISSNFYLVVVGESPPEPESGEIKVAAPPAPPLPPSRITNLVVVGSSSVTLTINWSDPISQVALSEYDIRISTTAISALNWNSRQRLTNNIPTPGVAETRQSYIVFPLVMTNRYYVAIKVKNANGVWSAMSNLAVGSTSAGQPIVSLAWDPSPDADVVNYRLYWGPSSGVYNGSSDLGNVTSTVFTQLTPGGQYFFVVTAFNASGAESDPSNELDYLVPGGGMDPGISDIADHITTSGVAVGPLDFTVSDAETAVGTLAVSGASSNTGLVSVANIRFGGSGANRTVTVTPTAGQTGTATITITVLDIDANTSTDTFVVTVN